MALDTDIWEAARFERFMGGEGRTQPALLNCSRKVGNTEQRCDFVVKACGHPFVNVASLANELIGSAVARAFGCAGPNTGLVNLSGDFLASAAGDYQAKGFLPTPGLAIGSELIENFAPMTRYAKIGDKHLHSGQRTYALDLAIQNPDRRPEKPNCAFDSEDQLLVFDFEAAFSFREPFIIGGVPEPWQVSKLAFCQNHLFYTAIKQQPIDWMWVPEALAGMAKELPDIQATLPAVWSGGTEQVFSHLKALAKNEATFRTELDLSLR